MEPLILLGVIDFIGIVFLFASFITVEQNTVAIIIRFGKYHSYRYAGLNTKMPFIDSVKPITLQNISAELEFQAITLDQANVYFKALMIYSVKDATEDSIKKVAFTFADDKFFYQALSKTVEGMVRSFIAGKRQQEVLSLRKEIVDYVQEHIQTQLDQWGYTLHDIQVNDITFDKEVIESMARVVASSNLKSAATNEGDAVVIKKTKEAEAEGAATVIRATKEKEAEILRGEGVAGFREQVAKGMKDSLDTVNNDYAVNLITFSMWMDTLKSIAENGQGNFISFDGSGEGMSKFFESTVIKNGNGKTVVKPSGN